MSSTGTAPPPGQKILAARKMLALERKVSGYRVEMPIHGTNGPRTSFFHWFVWTLKISLSKDARVELRKRNDGQLESILFRRRVYRGRGDLPRSQLAGSMAWCLSDR